MPHCAKRRGSERSATAQIACPGAFVCVRQLLAEELIGDCARVHLAGAPDVVGIEQGRRASRGLRTWFVACRLVWNADDHDQTSDRKAHRLQPSSISGNSRLRRRPEASRLLHACSIGSHAGTCAKCHRSEEAAGIGRPRLDATPPGRPRGNSQQKKGTCHKSSVQGRLLDRQIRHSPRRNVDAGGRRLQLRRYAGVA